MRPSNCSRRFFLKISLLTTFSLTAGNSAWARHLPEEKQLPGKLRLFNTHTGERLQVAYRTQNGSCDKETLDSLNWLLRCHYNNDVCPIDIQAIKFLNKIHHNLKGEHEIHIISGYRSPQYNELLRRKNGGVAKRSLHLQGKALDIRVPGVRLATLRKTALNLKMGGVGYYPKSSFIHIDSGSFRTW